MIFGRLRLMQRDQRGVTLLELLIAIALAGIVTGGITAMIFQVFNMNSRTSSHMTAIRQVQHAGKQVSQDFLQAQTVSLGDSSGFPLTLTWTDWDNKVHKIEYSLEDMPPGELKILWRKHYVDSALNSTKVAEYIDPDGTSVVTVPGGGAYDFTVTANVGGQSETRIYEVKPRPG